MCFIYIIILVVIIVLIILLLKYGYRLGLRDLDALIFSNAEFNNIKVWEYNVKKDVFTTKKNKDMLCYNLSLKQFADLFPASDSKVLIQKINNLICNKSKYEKFKAFLKGKNSSTSIVLNMTVVKHIFLKAKIVGTYYELNKSAIKKFSEKSIFGQYRELFDSISAGLILATPGGDIIDINDNMIKFWGFKSKDNVINNNILDDKFVKNHKLKQNIINGTFEQIVDINNDTNSDKNSFYISSKQISLNSGTRYLLIIVIKLTSTDIINAQYLQLHGEIETILKMTSTGVIICDKDSKMKYINDAYIKMMGLKDANSILKLKPSIDKSLILKQNGFSINNDNNTLRKVIKINFSDPKLREFYGSKFTTDKYFHISFEKVFDKDNKIMSYIFIILDITDTEKGKQEKNELINLKNLLMKVGKFVGWIYNRENRNVKYIDRKFPNINEASEILNSIHPHDIVAFENSINVLLSRNLTETRCVIRISNPEYKDQYEYWDTSLSIVENNTDNIYCISHNVTEQTISRKKQLNDNYRTYISLQGTSQVQFDIDIQNNLFTIINNINNNISRIMSFDDILNYIHKDDRNKYSDIINDIKSGKNQSFTFNYRTKIFSKDETYNERKLTLVPMKLDDNKNVIVYTGLSYDYSKWDKTINNAKETNEVLNAIIDKIPCLFSVKDVDNDLKYIIINEMACQELHFDRNHFVGYNDYDLLGHSNEADAIYQNDMIAIENGFYVSDESIEVYGKRIYMHCVRQCFETKHGRLLITASQNQTTINNLYNQLSEEKQKAERSDKLKSAFLANMSHEIRTPLNAIVGFAELLSTNNNKEKIKQYTDIISRNSEQLLNLINDILDISKIEAGYINLKPKQFDIIKLINDTYTAFLPKMPNDVTLLLDPLPQTYQISSDEYRIGQIINNFMSNAIKFTKEGSIKLGLEINEPNIKIYVEDTGIGIPKDKQDLVFERFEKFNDFIQGTGLGLSICKAIADCMGAEIGFETEENVGSTFWFKFDIINEKNTDFTDNQPNIIVQKNNYMPKNILVVEDDESNFILIKTILNDYNIERAINGEEAVNMVKDNKYDIILMDLRMPKKNGLEATREIRVFNTDTPIIAVSANAFDSDKQDALQAGCNEYLSKPVSPNILKKTINNYFN
ncbi:MAG: response regulator [Bacteroidales bacterium]|nr:response regulator [Bacteroidales bacterium]